MKKTLLFLASAALLLMGCVKEQLVENAIVGENETVDITFSAVLDDVEAVTKAVADKDGRAKNVNHWVMEVRDAQNDLFIRDERDVKAGRLEQTYKLKLFKNQSYTLQFWADTKGAYVTDDLTAISTVGSVANVDSRDAFSANVPYTSLKAESKTVTLKRPFGQLNIITTDLKELKKNVVDLTYRKYAPADLKVVAKIPTTFNVQTQKAGDAVETTLTAAASYADFLAGKPETTLFMDYIFASADQKDIVNFAFSFKTDNNLVSYHFTSIPMQRNYRTNIKGQLMSNDSEWIITIDPEWETPDYENIPVQSVSLDKTSMTLFAGDEATLTATILPADATVQGITWSSSNEEVATVDESGNVKAVSIGTATITATSKSDDLKAAACAVTVDHNYVEMAGLKWATCNIGAETPKQAGWYFSWGNTEGYINNGSGWVKASDGTTPGSFSSDSYKSTTGYTLDGNIIPDGGQDAARLNWGLKWRMPSSAEFQALYEACGGEGPEQTPEVLSTNEPEKGIYWLTADQSFIEAYKGVAGVLFVDESGTQLFFPVTGNGNESTSLKYPDTGRYWASTLNYPEPDNERTAYKLYLTETKVYPQWATPQCYRGYAIRAVKDIDE